MQVDSRLFAALAQKCRRSTTVLSPRLGTPVRSVVRLWADEENGEFSLTPFITQADTTNNTAAEPDAAIES